MEPTELSRKQTIMQIVDAYEQAVRDITESQRLLKRADETLQAAFSGAEFWLFDSRSLSRFSDLESYIGELDKKTWQKLFKLADIEKFMSSERVKDLRERIESGGMGNINREAMMLELRGAYENIGNMMQESVKEVFEILRPHYNRFKTNTQFDIGRKVILETATSWNGQKWNCYYQDKNINAIDTVFHNLDGAGIIKTYQTPLLMAVTSTTTGLAETDYFKVKLYRNGNLHLEFKRMDLVKKLNAIAGGNALYEATE